MNPQFALITCFIIITIVFWYDHKKYKEVSTSSYIPLFWIFILGTQSVYDWLNKLKGYNVETSYDTGSQVDRLVMLILIIIAIAILSKRKYKFKSFYNENKTIIFLFGFALFSVLWADAPFISIKRWTRGFGSLLMIFVIFSEEKPIVSTTTIIRRLCYIVIPLSIIFIRYFREIGVTYGYYDGLIMYTGVCGHKNQLGRLCLVSCTYFTWDIYANYWKKKLKNSIDNKLYIINIVYLIMSIYLIFVAKSSTSLACTIAAIATLLSCKYDIVKKRLLAMMPFLICFLLVSEYLFSLSGYIITALGRDITLTGRTELWAELLEIGTNPIIGVGYGSFWISDRFDILWENKFHELPTEAHNGFLGVYLDLGITGVLLWISIYITYFKKLTRNISLKNNYFIYYQLCIFVSFLLYNITEANMSLHNFSFFIFCILMACPLVKKNYE